MVTDNGSRDSVILTAGMLLEQQREQVPFRIAAHVADAAGKQLVFIDTPLSEVLQTIEVIYHIHVLGRCCLTAATRYRDIHGRTGGECTGIYCIHDQYNTGEERFDDNIKEA